MSDSIEISKTRKKAINNSQIINRSAETSTDSRGARPRMSTDNLNLKTSNYLTMKEKGENYMASVDKRPSVLTLIQRFDVPNNQGPVPVPLPRRKSQSYHRTDNKSPSSSPHASDMHIFQGGEVLKSVTFPLESSTSTEIDISLKSPPSAVFPSELDDSPTSPSSVSIVVSDGNSAKPPPDIELKPKPVFRKSLPSNHNLARSNATNKKRSSLPVNPLPGTNRRMIKLEFGNNQYDVYLVFKLIGQVGSLISELQIRYDENLYLVMVGLLNDYGKYVSATSTNNANMEKWCKQLVQSIDQRDYKMIRKLLLVTSFEFQLRQNTIPIQNVSNFKIEACSLPVVDYYYPAINMDDDQLLSNLLSNISSEYVVNSSQGDKLVYLDSIAFSADNLPIIFMNCFDVNVLSYKRLFVGTDHKNLIGNHEKYGEFVMSIKRENLSEENCQYRVLFRCKNIHRLFHLVLPDSEIQGSKSSMDLSDKICRYITLLLLPKADISKIRRYEHLDEAYASNKGEKSTITERVEKAVIQLDQHKTAFSYKFGVLYITQTQCNETQWFNNVLHMGDSKSFDNFCQILGDFIELKGHSGFTGGLDTKNGMTGEYSLYTKCKYDTKTAVFDSSYRRNSSNEQISKSVDEVEFEIMYHVSTLLPYTDGDEQQIQRKRHIGNDLVCIVFIDKDGFCTTPIPGQNPEPSTLVAKSHARRSGTSESVRSASTVFSLESSSTLDSLNASVRKDQKSTHLVIEAPFDPRTIRSQFLHVYVVVQEILVDPSVINSPFPTSSNNAKSNNSATELVPAYRIYTTSSLDVPNFSPSLPDPPIFPIATDQDRLNVRNFLLSKLINAENAAFQSNKFRTLHGRTYTGLMESIWKEFGENQDTKAHRMDDIDIKSTISTMLGRRMSAKPKTSISSSASTSSPIITSNSNSSSVSMAAAPLDLTSLPPGSTKMPTAIVQAGILASEQSRRQSSDSIKRSSIVGIKQSQKPVTTTPSKNNRPASAGNPDVKSGDPGMSFLEFLNDEPTGTEEKLKDGILGKFLKRKESITNDSEDSSSVSGPNETKDYTKGKSGNVRKNRLSMDVDDLGPNIDLLEEQMKHNI